MFEKRLCNAPAPAKFMVILLLISLGIGYLFALGSIYSHTNMSVQTYIDEVRGNEEEEIYPKEFGTMATSGHTHLIGHSAMFFILCWLLLYCSVGNKLKAIVIGISFLGFIVDQLSMWGVRYIAGGFAYLLFAAGGVMGVGFLLLFIILLREVLFLKCNKSVA